MSINATHYAPHPPIYSKSDSPENDQAPTTSATSRKKRGVADTAKLWPQGSTIKIAFVDMTKEEAKLVKDNINKWTPYVNLKFEYITEPKNADVRVEVNRHNNEGWAYIGTDNKKHPDDRAHVTIGTKAPKRYIEDTIIHEWGHVLGLRHEHQHPYRKLEQPDFEHTPRIPDDGTVTVAPYDKDSIMHYTITHDSKGNSILADHSISEEDKKFISSLYPPLKPKTPNPATRHPLQNPST